LFPACGRGGNRRARHGWPRRAQLADATLLGISL